MDIIKGVKSHIQKVLFSANKKSLRELFTSWDFGKMNVDGNMGHNILVRASDGEHVGTDYNGNKYYEDNAAMYTRKRWVVYADIQNYSPTNVPAEWHGWLNYINDFKPTEHDFKMPKYAVQATTSNTGSVDVYQPKGAWNNPQRRSWKKYEAWVPPQVSAAAPPTTGSASSISS